MALTILHRVVHRVDPTTHDGKQGECEEWKRTECVVWYNKGVRDERSSIDEVEERRKGKSEVEEM